MEIKDIEITIKEIKNILNKINLEKNDKENIKKISYGLYDELKSEKDEDVKEFLKKYVCIKKKPMKYQKNCFP